MNVWAVIGAAVSSFLIGGVWYSPALFGRMWNVENGGRPPDGHPARVFGFSVLFSLAAASCFAVLVGPTPAPGDAIRTGLLVGLGCVAASFGINYQFAQRSFKLWLIDGGYHVVQFAVFGLIIGVWQ